MEFNVVTRKNLGDGFTFDDRAKKIHVRPSTNINLTQTAPIKIAGNVVSLEYDDQDFKIEQGKLKLKAQIPTTPPESRYVDVRSSVTTNIHQLSEGSTADIIYTVTNTGSATASTVTLDITNTIPGSKRVSYGQHRIDKVKAANVNKTSDVKYVISGL